MLECSVRLILEWELRCAQEIFEDGELRTDPFMMTKSKLKKLFFFAPITFDSSGLETNISYRHLETFFLTYGPS
jgi:hypothetical protein